MKRSEILKRLHIKAVNDLVSPQWYSSGIYLDDEKQQVARVKQAIIFRWPNRYGGPKGEQQASRDAKEAVYLLNKLLKTGPFAGFEKDESPVVGNVAVVKEDIPEVD